MTTRYMDDAMGWGLNTARMTTVSRNEDRYGGHFWGWSSGDLPSSSSSASETVVIDRVNVFLNFFAVRLR